MFTPAGAAPLTTAAFTWLTAASAPRRVLLLPQACSRSPQIDLDVTSSHRPAERISTVGGLSFSSLLQCRCAWVGHACTYFARCLETVQTNVRCSRRFHVLLRPCGCGGRLQSRCQKNLSEPRPPTGTGLVSCG